MCCGPWRACPFTSATFPTSYRRRTPSSRLGTSSAEDGVSNGRKCTGAFWSAAPGFSPCWRSVSSSCVSASTRANNKSAPQQRRGYTSALLIVLFYFFFINNFWKWETIWTKMPVLYGAARFSFPGFLSLQKKKKRNMSTLKRKNFYLHFLFVLIPFGK